MVMIIIHVINVLMDIIIVIIIVIKIQNQKLIIVQNILQKQFVKLVYQVIIFLMLMELLNVFNRNQLIIVNYIVELLKDYVKNVILLIIMVLLKLMVIQKLLV